MNVIPPRVHAVVRIVVAVVIGVAVTAQLTSNIARYDINPVNFFSYFTILSNLLFAGILLISGLTTFRDRENGLVLECSRGAATVYMVTTGVVYALLLAGEPGQHTLPWVNLLEHRIAPVLALADWLVAAPRMRLPIKLWWSWLAFPFVYVAYTLLRGPVVDWYPYPFLDPALGGGYERVFVYCIGIAAFVVLLVLLTGWSGDRLRRRASRASHKHLLT